MSKHRRRSTALPGIRQDSPLRDVDPRIKLALIVVLAASIMLPLPRLLIALGLFLAGLAVGRLLNEAGQLLWRARIWIPALFLIDWAFIGLDFAILITLRVLMVLLISVVLFGTTTPEEFRAALRSLGMPYRFAFVLSLAFQSLPMIQDEVLAIIDAQKARGGLPNAQQGWRRVLSNLSEWTALAVPAIVLTTKRAWALTEAAHSRGFGSPNHKTFRQLRSGWHDWGLLLATVTSLALLFLIRRP